MGGPLDQQVGGTHYKRLAIQPVEYITANGIGYMEGNAIKYLTRWRDKGGITDLEKARHYIDLLIDIETRGLEKLMPHTEPTVSDAMDGMRAAMQAFGIGIPPAPEDDE